MIKLIEKQKIILMHTNEGKSQRQISRELKIDRKTVRTYLQEYEQKKNTLLDEKVRDSGLLIEDICQKPKYDSSSRKKVKLTDEMIEEIKHHLDQNQIKRATGRSKQTMAKIDIHEALIKKGHDIGYTTVCNVINNIDRKAKEAYIRQEYAPGKVAEFDWGQVKLIIAGRLTVFEMSAFTAAKSNYRDADIYHSQKTESFLDAHANFFENVGGVYSEIVYDNTKVAVARFVGKNQRQPTDALLKLSIYYGFSYRFANIAKPNEKGHVEKSVEFIRRKVFSKRDEFDSYEHAREYLRQELVALNLRPQTLQNGKCATDMLTLELPHMLLKPPRYDAARISEPRVSKYSCITMDNCYYSVPDDLVGEFVLAKIYTNKVLCYYRGVLVAEHKRLYGNHLWQIDIYHFTKTLSRKPGALASSVAFGQMQPKLLNIYNKYFKGAEKSFIELIELVSKIGIGKVEDAICELNALNPNSISTDKIMTICQRAKYRPEDKIIKYNSEIEIASRQIIDLYGKLLSENQLTLTGVK